MKKEVQTTELIRTSQSWDGIELPDYPQGRPELVAMKYEIPVHSHWKSIQTPFPTFST